MRTWILHAFIASAVAGCRTADQAPVMPMPSPSLTLQFWVERNEKGDVDAHYSVENYGLPVEYVNQNIQISYKLFPLEMGGQPSALLGVSQLPMPEMYIPLQRIPVPRRQKTGRMVGETISGVARLVDAGDIDWPDRGTVELDASVSFLRVKNGKWVRETVNVLARRATDSIKAR